MDKEVLVEEAKQQEKLESLYNEGIEAMKAQNWATAAERFNDIFRIDQSYRDAEAKLKEVQKMEAESKAKDGKIKRLVGKESIAIGWLVMLSFLVKLSDVRAYFERNMAFTFILLLVPPVLVIILPWRKIFIAPSELMQKLKVRAKKIVGSLRNLFSHLWRREFHDLLSSVNRKNVISIVTVLLLLSLALLIFLKTPRWACYDPIRTLGDSALAAVVLAAYALLVQPLIKPSDSRWKHIILVSFGILYALFVIRVNMATASTSDLEMLCATLTPTPTHAYTPTLTDTPKANLSTETPTVIPSSTPTNTPTPTSIPYPDPVLISPEDGAILTHGQNVKLVWERGQNVAKAEELFEVRIWSQGQLEFVSTAQTELLYYIVFASELAQIGKYEWQVVVVSPSGEEKSASQIWSFEVAQ